MWTIIVILNLNLVLGSTDDLDGPRNMVVFAGQPMEMECRADSNSTVSEWSMQKSFTANKKTIFVNTKGQQKIKNEHFEIIEGANGSVVLHRDSTEMDDAGIYTCAVQRSLRQPDRYSAHLIVFEGDPICETNLSTTDNNTFEDGTLLWMRCTLNFTGSWTPTLEWRLHEDNGETEARDLTDSANVEFVTNITISSTLTVALNATINTSYFSCKIYFSSVSNSELVTASNSPEYNHIWNSPFVASLPKPFVSTAQWIGMTTDDLTDNRNDPNSTFNVSSSIYLVAGVAVLFGIASSLVALILCLRLRRKNSAAAMNNIDRMEPLPSDYDLIPYACTDGYDTIEEVEAKDDILITNFPPRLGRLPSLHYSGLAHVERKPPNVYSRMDLKEKQTEDEESDIAGHANTMRSMADQSELQETDESTRVNSYLELFTNGDNENSEECKAMPYEYVNTTKDVNSAEPTMSKNQLKQKSFPEDGYLIPNDFLK